MLTCYNVGCLFQPLWSIWMDYFLSEIQDELKAIDIAEIKFLYRDYLYGELNLPWICFIGQNYRRLWRKSLGKFDTCWLSLPSSFILGNVGNIDFFETVQNVTFGNVICVFKGLFGKYLYKIKNSINLIITF